MTMEREDLTLYTVHVEGSILALRDREYVETVVAQSTEFEDDHALVMVTPEQAAKLPELLRVREIAPAADGIYVGRTGTWYAVNHGAVTESGQWMIPLDVLASFREKAPAPAQATSQPPTTPASPVGIASQTGSDERDPVCGVGIKPGTEAASVTYQEQMYHFCSVECREIFLQRPSLYVEHAATVR